MKLALLGFFPLATSIDNLAVSKINDDDDDDTLYLTNYREFTPTSTSDIISYRKKMNIQGTDNGCCGVTVQKIKIREKNRLSCMHHQPLVINSYLSNIC